MVKKKINVTVLQSTLRTCRVMFIYAIMFGALINILMLSTPIYSMQVLDRVISSGNTDTLVMLSIVIGLSLLLLALLQGARSFAMTAMGSWFEKKISKDVLNNSIQLSLTSGNNVGSQKIRDLQTVKNFLTSPQLLVMMDTPWAVIFIIVLYILHPMIGTIALIGGIVLIIFGVIADKATKTLHQSYNEMYIKNSRVVEQTTKNAEVISVMGFSNNVVSKWEHLNNSMQRVHSLVTKRQTVFSEVTKFFRILLQVSITGVGALLVIKGEITPGTIIASSAMMGRALAPFEATINAWKQFIKSKQSYTRLNNGFDISESKYQKMSYPAPEGKLNIQGVTYIIPKTRTALVQNASFNLEVGESLAIMGASGSGKSSLAKLIVGAYKATSGFIRIDGMNINDWQQDELGQYIGYLPQDIELFSGTVKENIARMDENAKSDDVIRAAQLAGAHDMIITLPDAYNTEIGVDGNTLSGGQRQRIGLARAFYGDPRLLVLDEPNSSLDKNGEQALYNALEIAKETNVTTIVISHRPSTLNVADKIMLISNGAISLFGPKDEVIQKMQGIKAANKKPAVV